VPAKADKNGKADAEGTTKDGEAGDGADKSVDKKQENEDKNADQPKPITQEDLKIPEGKTWDEETGKGFLDLINDTSISRAELTQKLIDMHSSLQDKVIEGQKAAQEAQVEADKEAMARLRADFTEACKKDPEFGGQKYEESKAIISKGCAALLTPELLEHFQFLGMDMHPDVVRIFYRAGKMMGEDPGVKGKTETPKEDGIVAMHRKILEMPKSIKKEEVE
jgi:hypothetical protein